MDGPKKTSLTGIKPTHLPHIGNYLGAIRPALRLAGEYKTLYFIADYHALTSVHDAELMRSYVHDVAASWLACGLDPNETIIFRQSDVPQVFELAWVFACLFHVGQLERSHAYKDAIAKGAKANAGLFNYPLLMAADIVLYDTDIVPVGKDQKQHIEIARDLATRLNHHFGEGTVVVPEARITEAPLVPGTDGQKMSKSLGNSIPLFDPPKRLRKAVMGITTTSEELDDPKDPEGSTVFEIFKLLATADEISDMAEKLRAGGYGWGHAKEDLYQALEREIAPRRDKFEQLRKEPEVLDDILDAGAAKARQVAGRTMRRVRSAIGVESLGRGEKTTVKIK
jgi:tryptophanyl-tRNA synthetase